MQELSFSGAASPYIYAYAGTPTSPIPIVRNEELTLVDAQIQLGLGNYATAITLINDVHTDRWRYERPDALPRPTPPCVTR